VCDNLKWAKMRLEAMRAVSISGLGAVDALYFFEIVGDVAGEELGDHFILLAHLGWYVR